MSSSLYADYIFPWVIDLVMRRPNVAAERPKAVSKAFGEVLEVGFGTGLNLPYYSSRVRKLVALDSSRALRRRVERRVAAVPFPVELIQCDAQRLPFESGRFDCVVTTFTLCSINDVATALAEIRRVLSPHGRYFFLEHGRSDDARIARKQDFWTPLQRVLACGCHLNRPIDRLIEDAGLHIHQLDRYQLPQAPRVLAELYLGETS